MALCRPAHLAAILSFLAFIPAAFSEEAMPRTLDLSGSIRGGFFSSSANLDDRKNVTSGAVWLKATPAFSDNLSIGFEGWVRNDDSFHTGGDHGRIREAYVSANRGDTSIRVGKQIIIWGRADRLNPTDNLTPRNYTWLMPLEDDQRTGTTAIKVSQHFGTTSLTGIWLPRFSPSTVPLAQPPGGYLSEEIPSTSQGALKLDSSGGEVEWSASFFNGLDLNPDMRIGALGPAGMNLVLIHNRIRVLGMDTATVVGRYGLRAEAAYTWTENAGTDDYLVRKSNFYLVAGGDRTISENLNVNIQYYLRHVSGYRDPRDISDPVLRDIAVQGAAASGQLIRFQHGLTLRIANKWLNESLEGEIAGVYSLSTHDYVIKPRMIYAFNDHLKGTLGMDIYRGERDTFFGRLRDISSAFGEIKYSF